MSTSSALRAAALAAILLATASVPAVATPPESVTIHMTADFSDDPPVFLWWSTGAIADSGHWVGEAPHWAAIPSPVVGSFHQHLTLVGDHGTVALAGEGVFTLTDDPDVALLTGRWRALGGTGAYAGAHGGGSFTVHFHSDPSVPDPGTFEGKLHFDPPD